MIPTQEQLDTAFEKLEAGSYALFCEFLPCFACLGGFFAALILVAVVFGGGN